MGEILDFMTFKNIITGEEICQLTLDCNDMQFDAVSYTHLDVYKRQTVHSVHSNTLRDAQNLC